MGNMKISTNSVIKVLLVAAAIVSAFWSPASHERTSALALLAFIAIINLE